MENIKFYKLGRFKLEIHNIRSTREEIYGTEKRLY